MKLYSFQLKTSKVRPDKNCSLYKHPIESMDNMPIPHHSQRRANKLKSSACAKYLFLGECDIYVWLLPLSQKN